MTQVETQEAEPKATKAQKISSEERETSVSKKSKVTEVQSVLVRDIEAALEDNPRFQTPGVTPQVAAKRYFESDDVKGVFANLDAEGIKQPLVVEPLGGGRFALIDGWTRHQWAKNKNKNGTRVPVIVREKSADQKELYIQRVSFNSARRDYNPMSQASSFAKVVQLCDGSETAAAKQIGVSKAAMRSRLRLLSLPKDLQRALGIGKMTLQAAESYMKLPGYIHWVDCREYAASKDEKAKAPSEAVLAAHDRFERAIKHMGKLLFADTSDDAVINHKDVMDAWDDFMTTEAEAAEQDMEDADTPEEEAEAKERLDDAVSDTRIIPPNKDVLWELCKVFGKQVAALVLKGGDKPKQGQLEEKIEIIGTCAGLCLAPQFRDEIKVAGGSDINEAMATRTTQATVREAVLSGLFEDLESKFYEGHPLNEDENWNEFVAKDRSLKEACEALEAASKEPKPKAEKKEEPKKAKKGNKKG